MSRRAMDCVAEKVEFKSYRTKYGTGYAIRFDYDPFLVALVKKMPSADRKYDPDGKWWWCTEERAKFIAMVAVTCGYPVTGIEPQPSAALPHQRPGPGVVAP